MPVMEHCDMKNLLANEILYMGQLNENMTVMERVVI
jgi:hypothetical protein